MAVDFSGVGVALVTPFKEDLSVDYPALKKLLDHTGPHVDYFVVAGTTGESVTLTREEKKQILSFIAENNACKRKIMLGVGGNNTAAVLHEVSNWDYPEADAILSVSPYYNKPSQAGLIQHFSQIADHCPVPVLLYNVPGRTGSNMSISTTLELANHRNIIGIKEASGDLSQCIRIAKDVPGDFLLISGDDLLTLPILSIGGVGMISVLANAYPDMFKRLLGYFRNANLTAAAEETYAFADINPLMYHDGSPSGVKVVLSELGICEPHVRLPHTIPSNSKIEQIKKFMEGLK